LWRYLTTAASAKRQETLDQKNMPAAGHDFPVYKQILLFVLGALLSTLVRDAFEGRKNAVSLDVQNAVDTLSKTATSSAITLCMTKASAVYTMMSWIREDKHWESFTNSTNISRGTGPITVFLQCAEHLVPGSYMSEEIIGASRQDDLDDIDTTEIKLILYTWLMGTADITAFNIRNSLRLLKSIKDDNNLDFSGDCMFYEKNLTEEKVVQQMELLEWMKEHVVSD